MPKIELDIHRHGTMTRLDERGMPEAPPDSLYEQDERRRQMDKLAREDEAKILAETAELAAKGEVEQIFAHSDAKVDVAKQQEANQALASDEVVNPHAAPVINHINIFNE